MKGGYVTLWGGEAASADARVLAYTIGDDRHWDGQLLSWDILGSLGHVRGLEASGLLTGDERQRLSALLVEALAAVRSGALAIGPEHEDAHSAVELWLSQRDPELGARLHTGRSRNDQIAVDLRLYLKDALLTVATLGERLVAALLDFAAGHARVLLPGYTHTRRAMPSTVGLWAAAFAEGLVDTLESLPALWRQVDRSPLGSAAGYGVPLPLDREATARALGFAGLVHAVTTTQNGRGKLEAAALAFAGQLGHELAKLSSDICLYSAEELGYFVLPVTLATGSSIMPHKRNPDPFELTRARGAALDGDLAMVLHIKGKLTSGYHRDWQLLKEPLLRGMRRLVEMLDIMALGVPALGVDAARCQAAISGGILSTDEVMRRVEAGVPFRVAYHDVAAALRGGYEPPVEAPERLLARRRSTGAAGNLRLGELRRRLRQVAAFAARERRRFDDALAALCQTDEAPARRRRPRRSA